ncbi:MAG: hypothetical protein IPM32_02390 [Ignavibacteriae bacterium]|nr:hypothetical protein [Ignavibacteriota bacterium]
MKLELEINKPVTIELLYDEPVTGRSEFGNYNMYAVSVNGNEYSYFAPDEVHKELSYLRKGAKATITKVAQQKGSKLVTKCIVDIFNRVPKSNIVSIGEAIKDILPTEVEDEPDEFFHIMKRSYSDALKINSDLNGMADPAKIAITLFIARSKTI